MNRFHSHPPILNQPHEDSACSLACNAAVNEKVTMKILNMPPTDCRSLKWGLLTTFALTFSVAGSQFALAQQAPKPVFTLDLSQGANALGADARKIPARIEGQYLERDTVRGKAFVSGPGAGYLHFPTSGIINAEAGTVEMWVSPLDWEGTEQKFHTFFSAHGEGSLLLYKYYLYGLQMTSITEGSKSSYPAAVDMNTWKPGDWRFIVGTWSPSRIALYVDGKLVGENKPQVGTRITPKSISGEFEIGDNDGGSMPRTSQTLVTGVRIYDRALSTEHIAAHYAGDLDKFIPLSPTVLSADLEHDVYTHQLNVKVGLNGADVDEKQTTAEFSLQRDGKTVRTLPPEKFTDDKAQAHFSSEQLTPGTYQVVANVKSGEQQAKISRDWIVPDLSWQGNTLGKVDKVLAPWTPMEVRRLKGGGFDVVCWGRVYQFRNAPLPTQILSQNRPMLARPIALNLQDGTQPLGAQPLLWRNGRAALTQSSPTHVVVTGTADADTPAGRVSLKTTMRLEYDGLVTLDFDLQKPAGWQPQQMALEIPVAAKHATFYQRADVKQWNSPSGLVPVKQGVVDQSNFQPFAWLGDDARGLFWFCETAQFWPNWASGEALQIVRDEAAVSIRANLLNGQPLPDNWKFQCGLQATPVKAIPADWRKRRLAPAPRSNLAIVWPNPQQDSLKYFGYPEPTDPAAYAAKVKEIQDRGMLYLQYSCLAYASSAAPEYRWFKKQWDMGLSDATSSDVLRYNASFDAISPRQQSVQDFFVWKNLQLMKSSKLDGFYHDQSSAVGSTNANAGYGWQDGDKRQPTYGILAMRQYYRRLRAAMKQAKPGSYSIAHMSGQNNIPFLAYEDVILNGEQFRHYVKDSYMDVLTLAQLRAIFNGRQWGVVSYFLPSFEPEYVKKVEPTRGLAALLMLHDITPWTVDTTGNMAEWGRMFDALDGFGYADSAFLPYWAEQPPAKTTIPDVYVSAYKRKDGRALVVVGNTSREARSGTMTLDTKALGLPLNNILSWPEGKKLVAKDGTIEIAMEGLDYRLLLVGKSPTSKPSVARKP
jgi:hypothetical protein